PPPAAPCARSRPNCPCRPKGSRSATLSPCRTGGCAARRRCRPGFRASHRAAGPDRAPPRAAPPLVPAAPGLPTPGPPVFAAFAHPQGPRILPKRLEDAKPAAAPYDIASRVQGELRLADLAVFYEHPQWFEALFACLDRRGVDYVKIPIQD